MRHRAAGGVRRWQAMAGADLPARLPARLIAGLLDGIVAGVVAVVLVAAPAAAHDGGIEVSEIRIEGSRVDYDLYLDSVQLGAALRRGDGDVRLAGMGGAPGTSVRRADVARLIAAGITVESGGVRAEPRLVDVGATSASALTWLGGVSRLGDVPLLRARVRYEFPSPVRDWRIGYGLFQHPAGRQPHGNLAWLHVAGRTYTHVFAPGAGPLVPGVGRPVEGPPGQGDTPPPRDRPAPAPLAAVAAVAFGIVGVVGVVAVVAGWLRSPARAAGRG